MPTDGALIVCKDCCEAGYPLTVKGKGFLLNKQKECCSFCSSTDFEVYLETQAAHAAAALLKAKQQSASQSQPQPKKHFKFL